LRQGRVLVSEVERWFVVAGWELVIVCWMDKAQALLILLLSVLSLEKNAGR
jgi:hypothetical protein